MNTLLEISKKITECSQLDKIEILISLRAFLLGHEDCPWFIFCKCFEAEELIIKTHAIDYLTFKKQNEANLKRINLKPIDIFLLPKNKKNIILDHINSVIDDFYPECVILHDCVRSNPYAEDYLFIYIEENDNNFSEAIYNLYKMRSIEKKKLIKDADIPKRIYETSYSISRKNKIIDYWKNTWGLSEKYIDQTIVDQIIL